MKWGGEGGGEGGLLFRPDVMTIRSGQTWVKRAERRGSNVGQTFMVILMCCRELNFS